MNCDLCTMDTIRGTMWRMHGKEASVVCDDCRSRLMTATREEINEPMCPCNRAPAWVCKAAIRKPCDEPQITHALASRKEGK